VEVAALETRLLQAHRRVITVVVEAYLRMSQTSVMAVVVEVLVLLGLLLSEMLLVLVVLALCRP